MTKKTIKHPYDLMAMYSVYEDTEDVVDYVIAKVFELNESKFGEDVDLMYDMENHKDKIKFYFTKITPNAHINDIVDIADSISSDIVNAVSPIMKAENQEFINVIFKTEMPPIYTSTLLYLNKVEIKGDYSEDSIAASLSTVLKNMTKGLEPTDWIFTTYSKNTFFNNGEEIKNKKVKKILKDVGLFDLPESLTNFNHEDNVVNIGNGSSLNFRLELKENNECNQKKKI